MKKNTDGHTSSTLARRRGFTLLEMMFASTIGIVLVAGAFSAFIFQRRAFLVQQQVNEMQQNVRASIDVMTRDLHMAGYGLKGIPTGKTGEWVTWVFGMTDNPTVIQGDEGTPDRMLIAAAFDDPVARITSPTTNRTTVITVSNGDAFNTKDKKVIYIGRTETARVVARVGNTLTISRDPVVTEKGLRYAYEVGTPIELVRVVEYAWQDATTSYPFEPHLTRSEMERDYAAPWQSMCAGNIDDLQATRVGYDCDIVLTGRTSEPDPHYTHPEEGDHYRRLTLTRSVYPRNAALWR